MERYAKGRVVLKCISAVVKLFIALTADIAADNTSTTSENNNYDNDNNSVNCESFPELKKGIKLPKNDSEWSTANDYFKFALQTDHPIAPQDINSKIKLLNDAVPDQNLISKYKEHTVKELKKALQHLKSNKGNLGEIKYVSRALRDKLRNNSNNADGLNSKIQNNGNSENKHFEFILAFDYILVIIRNNASYITVVLI